MWRRCITLPLTRWGWISTWSLPTAVPTSSAAASKSIEFARRLYIVRRVFEQASNGTYVPSLSSRTIVYKGCLLYTSSVAK